MRQIRSSEQERQGPFLRSCITRLDLIQIGRFVLVGAGRTAFSFGLYLLLLRIAPYWLAFSASFFITITASAMVNSRYVFLVGLNPRSYLVYVAIYLLNYVVSLALLVLVIDFVGLPKYLAPLPVAVCMLPINFLLERYALQSGK